MKYSAQTQVISVVLLTGVALMLAGGAYYWGVPLIEKTQKSVESGSAEQTMYEIIDAIKEVAETGNTKTIPIKIKGELKVNPDEDYIEYSALSPTSKYATTAFVPLNDMPPFKQKIYVVTPSIQTEVPECNLGAGNCKISINCEDETITFNEMCVTQGSFSNGQTVDCVQESFKVITDTCNTYGLGYILGNNTQKIFGIVGRNEPLVLTAKTVSSPTRDSFVNIYRIYSREMVDPNTKIGKIYNITTKSYKETKKGSDASKIIITKKETDIIPGGSSFNGDLYIITIQVDIE